jgi:hypothetical protein
VAWEPDYATLAELREYVTRSSETVDDVDLAIALTAASRAVDLTSSQGMPRQFGLVASAEERRYTPRGSRSRGSWVVEVDDFQTTTGLLVNLDLDGDGTFSDAITGFTKLPLNAAAKGYPWEKIVIPDTYNGSLCGKEGEVAATAKWGWTAVPTAVKLATLLQGSRFMKRREAPFGVAGSPESGTEIRLLARVDPDVAVSLRKYVRHAWGLG